MRGVMLEVPPAFLAERSRLGHDRHDEMWEGELHMVPPASHEHQRIGTRLLVALDAAAVVAGRTVIYETGLFDPAIGDFSSYRVPDLAVFGPAVGSRRGMEGAADLVVEIRSPGDESMAKLPFYERVGVGEVLIVDRDTKHLRHWSRHGDVLVESILGADGVQLTAVDLHLVERDGRLVVTGPGGTTEI